MMIAPPHNDRDGTALMASARHNMVVSQVRTCCVTDDRLVEIIAAAPRDAFVPEAWRTLAYADMNIPLGDGEVMMTPLVESRLLQSLDLRPQDRVLEIGTGSGYLTWLLSQLTTHVTSVEIRPDFAQSARARLEALGARNITIETGDGAHGWPAGTLAGTPWDVILIGGSLPVLPPEFARSLAAGGRLAGIIGQGSVMEARRVSAHTLETVSLFETVLTPLRHAETPTPFTF